VSGDYAAWPVQPKKDKKTGDMVLDNGSWKRILGDLMFDVPETEGRYAPSFRSLFSYFVRRQSVGGFLNPFYQAKNQQPGDEQVNVSFLLGLDWVIPQGFQRIREQDKMLKALRTATQEGVLGDIISRTSDLRTQLTIVQNRAERLRRSIADFRVLPEYRDLEQEASDLTEKISRLSDENTIDRQLLLNLGESLNHEIAPSGDRLERIYREAGVILPETTLRRFEDVRLFHESVVANRRSYLQGDIAAANERIHRREGIIADREERRAQIMGILQSHGALEHFRELQSELSRVEGEVEGIRQRYAAAERIEMGKTDLDLERQQLLRRLHQDYQERNEGLRKAILAFEEVSETLYEVAGNLVVNPSANGPQFEVKIQGQRSGGISNMQIFCFDMMLMKLCAERGIGPRFLFHDSHLFDGVDERQVATALQIGAHRAEELGFQYIVTMNEDAVPTSMPSQFDLGQYILTTRLTDATEDGGLFGIRFG
jgi:uncharacterized protein YydD (DUF2326 family)